MYGLAITPAFNPIERDQNMTKKIDTTAPAFDLVALRLQVATAENAVSESRRAYAVALNSTLCAAWYTMRHDGVSDEARAVRRERDALFAVLKENNHSNPSAAWAKIKEYAKQEAEGLPTEAEKKRGKPEARDLVTRFSEELLKLYKAGHQPETVPAPIVEALPIIEELLIDTFHVNLGEIH